MKHIINIKYGIFGLSLIFLISACAKIDSAFTVKSSSNTLTTLVVTFANGTGSFKPTVSEPYPDNITIEIPWYYPDGSYTETKLDSLLITATLPNSAYMSPAFGLTNLTSSKIYTLTAQNGDQHAYTITAVRKRSSKTDITSFKLNEANISGVIVNNKIIIPYTTESVTSQTATVELANYATISPNPTLVHDYSVPVKYTVTADDGTTAEYTVQLGTATKLAQGFSTVKKLWTKASGDLNFVDYQNISIAVSGDYLVIPFSNEWTTESSAKYYNRKTGTYVGDLNVTGVNGLYSIANDSIGNIVGINNIYAGENVRLYKWSSATASPQLLAKSTDWTCVNSTFYGRKISVYGNLDGNAVIMSTTDGTTAGGANRILKWTVKNGAIVSQDPEVVTYSKDWGYVAKAVPTGPLATDNYFVCSNLPIFMDYINESDNSILYSFSSSYLLSMRSATPALTYFEFNNAQYTAIVDASEYSGAMHIFNVTDPSKITTPASTGSTYTAFHVFDGESDYLSCPSANWNITAEIAVGPVSSDGFYKTVYFMLTNGGIVAYELSCIDTSAY
jgi:hypothetical protein